MTITRRDLLVRDAAPRLLACCKELREALAAAMHVIAEHADDEKIDNFLADIAQLGIAPGVGLRADEVIADAEGRPRPHVDTERIVPERFDPPLAAHVDSGPRDR